MSSDGKIIIDKQAPHLQEDDGDRLFNDEGENTEVMDAIARFLGVHGAPNIGWPEKLFVVQQRAATRACIRQILEWDFDKIVMSHGHTVEKGGKDAFASAWQWLLDDDETH